MGVFSRDGNNIEIPEHKTRPALWTAETPHGVVHKYKVITPTVNYYIEADTVKFYSDYIIFKMNDVEVACISLNTVYGFLMIDSRAASSEGQA